MNLLLLLLSVAHAGSLDALEVGGFWGHTMATDSTALWWNPAGLGAESGTRITFEAAPTFAVVRYDRDDPITAGTDYTDVRAVIPYAGIATDFGVKGLGVGLSMYVPYGKGGAIRDEIPWMSDYPQDGAVPPDGGYGRYHLRAAKVQAIYFTLGGAYNIADRVSIGAGASLVSSSWKSRLDSEVLSALDAKIEESLPDSGYSDAMVEDPHYATTVNFSTLKDTAFTFNAGLRVEIIPEKVAIGGSYNHSVTVANKGTVDFHFNCPPATDALGRFGAEALGICYTNIDGNAQVSYKLPARAMGGILVRPIPELDVNLMGGWVGWGVFKDYTIEFSDIASLNADNPDVNDSQALADALEKTRLRARDANNTWFAGADVKGTIADKLTLGGRILYDASAIPSYALAQNNYDANTIILGGLVAYKPIPQIQIGVGFSHYFIETRTVTDSAYGVTVTGTPKEDRWFYPHANGTYEGSINRLSLSVRALLGQKKDKAEEPVYDAPMEEYLEPPAEQDSMEELAPTEEPAPIEVLPAADEIPEDAAPAEPAGEDLLDEAAPAPVETIDLDEELGGEGDPGEIILDEE